jgi:hypothetical protein
VTAGSDDDVDRCADDLGVGSLSLKIVNGTEAADEGAGGCVGFDGARAVAAVDLELALLARELVVAVAAVVAVEPTEKDAVG